MSTNSNTIFSSDLNEPPVEGSGARASTATSPTSVSSTMGHLVSVDPMTPNLQRDDDIYDHTPVGPDEIATPPTQRVSRLSISERATNPKVPHRLAASGHIGSDGNRPTRSSVAINEVDHHWERVEVIDHTEGAERSPESDQFENDDQVPTQSPVAAHEPVDHLDQVEANDQIDVVQQSSASEKSFSSSSFSANATMADPDPDHSLQSSPPVQPEFTGNLTTNPMTFDSDEDVISTAVQRSSTSGRSGSEISPTKCSTANPVPTPPATTPAESSIDLVDPIVQALADLSPPFTFDGDIVMPDGHELKLFLCEKGYDASSRHEEDDEDGVAQRIDVSKEQHFDFRLFRSQVWDDIVDSAPFDIDAGDVSQKYEVYCEMKADQFSLKPDLIAASGIIAVIEEQLNQRGKLSLDTNHATLRVCSLGSCHGTDVPSIPAKDSRIGTVVLGLPIKCKKGDIVVRKAAKPLPRTVVFDWSKQWMSQDASDVRPRWMYFPYGTRYTSEDTCDDKHRDSERNDIRFVIEYPVYVNGSVKHVPRPSRTKLVKAFRSVIAKAPQDYRIRFILSRPATQLGKESLNQLERTLDNRHSTQPDAILYEALKFLGLGPTFERVDYEPINPVSRNYPKVKATVEANFPARVREEAKRVISLSYEKSKPVVLIGAPILDHAENVGGRVIMTIEIPKAKDLIKAKGE